MNQYTVVYDQVVRRVGYIEAESEEEARYKFTNDDYEYGYDSDKTEPIFVSLRLDKELEK